MAARGSKTRWMALFVLGAGILGGCQGGPSKWALPGAGSSVDFDRHAKKLEVRPLEISLPVGKQVLLLATVYDDANKPRPKRRVDWKIEGAGIVQELDEGGFLQGRGFKEDSKSAVTFTNTSEHPVPPGVENPLGQVIHPGQTWCVITSANEGQTTVHAYAPEIADSQHNRVVVKVNWVDAAWQFPEASAARAGTELLLQTKISRHSDKQPVSNYRVRYSLLDNGAVAGLYPPATPKGAVVREVMVSTTADGTATAKIAQLNAEFGTSQVAIEVQRPDATQPGGYVVVAKSQTKVDWQAPAVKLSVEAPKSTPINQAFPVTYSVASTGSLETLPMVLKTVVPPGVELVSSNPKATVDGNELLWSLPSLPGGKQHTVQAVYRPTRTGSITATSSVRTNDNLRDDGNATVEITEAKLQIAMTGPPAGVVGENLSYQVVVKNVGTGTATNVKISALFDAGLELVNGTGPFETTIDKFEAGQTQTIKVPLSPRQAGKSAVKAYVKADNGLQAESAAVGVEIKKPQLVVEVTGPPRGYAKQEITWNLHITNPSDVTFSDVVLRATIPPELTFRRASNDGQAANGVVEWKLGTLVAKQWLDVQVTGLSASLGAAVLTANLTATPLANRDGAIQQVSMVKAFNADSAPASVEILGVPALQLHVIDSADPASVGQTVTFTITVKNSGTLAASQVETVADLPPQFKPLRVSGPTNGKIDGQHITFPAVQSIKPDAVSVFTVEALALSEGDARFHAEVRSPFLTNQLSMDELTRVLPRPDAPKR